MKSPERKETGDKGVILWDFDGTLAFREGLWGACLLEVLDAEEVGHSVTRSQIGPLLATGYPWHKPETPHPELNESEAWWEMMNLLLSNAFVGLGYSSRRAGQLASKVRDRYTDPSSFELFDDTLPTLRGLKACGWSHAILSNHVPELPKIVAGLGLNELVANVYTSAATGFEKPHPGAYDYALQDLGRPESVWMVGDNVEADVYGAERAGLQAILVRTKGDLRVKHHSVGLAGVERIIS